MNPIRNIHVIGCGGVGSYLIPVLLKTFSMGSLHLWDGDTLEERNLDRQLFKPEHIGLNKASALVDVYTEGFHGELFQHNEYFTYGAWVFSSRDIVLCLVDNHAARRAVLQSCDTCGCTAIFGMNEYTEAQAILYKAAWLGTALDPRVRYPVIMTDDSDDPTRPEGCTGAVQVAHPQLALANAVSAQMALSHLFWLTQTAPELDAAVVTDYTPVEHLWASGRFSTRLSKDFQ